MLLSSERSLMAEPSPVRIERKSSIENEPRTLKMDQIQYAREAALYVVSTATMEEAMRIFTEGLKPVVCKEAPYSEAMMGWREEEEEEEEQFIELRPLHRLRDIVSAPF